MRELANKVCAVEPFGFVYGRARTHATYGIRRQTDGQTDTIAQRRVSDLSILSVAALAVGRGRN